MLLIGQTDDISWDTFEWDLGTPDPVRPGRELTNYHKAIKSNNQRCPLARRAVSIESSLREPVLLRLTADPLNARSDDPLLGVSAGS
jgi:hypothetical protein